MNVFPRSPKNRKKKKKIELRTEMPKLIDKRLLSINML